MDNALNKLCALLEDELARQDAVLAVCEAQNAAAKAHDVTDLEEQTAALGGLIQEALDAEQERIAAVAEIVQIYTLPVERQTLSALIEVCPEPWSSKLTDLQKRIRRVVQEVRSVVLRNNFVMRRSQQVIERSLGVLVNEAVPDSPLYSATGTCGANAQPVMLLNEEG